MLIAIIALTQAVEEQQQEKPVEGIIDLTEEYEKEILNRKEGLENNPHSKYLLDDEEKELGLETEEVPLEALDEYNKYKNTTSSDTQ